LSAYPFSMQIFRNSLSIYELKKGDLQPLVDAIAAWLPPWCGRLLSKAGRVSLTKSTLSAIPIHTSIAVKVSLSIFQAVDKIRRSFIWSGSDSTNGGKCTVAWAKVTRPTNLGGLGATDLATLGYALWLRWEWFARTDPERLDSSFPTKADHILKSMFDASTTVQVGNGARTYFWKDRWLQGSSILSIAPLVVEAVNKSTRKSRLVSDALQGDQWIRDISGSLSFQALSQCIDLWSQLQNFQLMPGVEDKFI
jgi:hypothetical protein